MKKLLVAYLLSPGPVVGGAETYVLELVRALRDHPFVNACVLVSHNRDFLRVVEAAGVSCHWLGATLREGTAALQQLTARRLYDVIHANGYHSNLLVQSLRLSAPALAASVLFCTTEHGWIYATPYERLKTRLEHKTLPLFDWVFVVNDSMKRHLEQALSLQRISTVNLFPASPLACAPVGQCEPSRTTKMVLGAGRLSPEKGFLMFIRIAAEMLRLDRAFQFVIIGEGSERPALESLIRELGLEARVHLPGFVADPSMHYRQAEFFLITSAAEGGPLVALEAALNGALVASTNVGIVPDLLGGSRGILLDAGAPPDALAAQLVALACQPEPVKEDMRDRAARYARTHYNVAKAIEHYVYIYTKLSHDRP